MWWGVLWTGFDSDGFGLGWLSQTETFLLCPPSLPQQGRHTCPGGAEAPMVLLGEFMHTLGDWRAHGCCWGGGRFWIPWGGWNTNGCCWVGETGVPGESERPRVLSGGKGGTAALGQLEHPWVLLGGSWLLFPPLPVEGN